MFKKTLMEETCYLTTFSSEFGEVQRQGISETFPLNFRQVEKKREQRTGLCKPSLEFYTLSDIRRQGSSDKRF